MANKFAALRNRINEFFLNLSPAEAHSISEKIKYLSRRYGVSMFTDAGKPKIIGIQLRPWLISPRQAAFYHKACLIMRGSLSKLFPLYFADAKVKETLPLEPDEERWLRFITKNGLQRPQTVFERLDSTENFDDENRKEDFCFLEPNSVGIGGIYYVPAINEIIGDVL